VKALILFTIAKELQTTLISAAAIILGTLIGALFTWIITIKNTKISIDEQYRILEKNRLYEETCKAKTICENANIIRLDICTAIFQSIRTIKEYRLGEFNSRYFIPVNKQYYSLVAYLSDKFDLKELSYIYQLYGIIEKLNHDMLNSNYYENNEYDKIIKGYEYLLIKLYGENFDEILKVDIDRVTYSDLYENSEIKDNYRKVLKKLDDLCCIDNIEGVIQKLLISHEGKKKGLI
jgi:hypothetical protein